jgi:hypothetical protein
MKCKNCVAFESRHGSFFDGKCSASRDAIENKNADCECPELRKKYMKKRRKYVKRLNSGEISHVWQMEELLKISMIGEH